MNWGRENGGAAEREGILSLERQKEEKKRGLRECGVRFAQEENLCGPQTGEQEVLSVAGLFANSIWSSNSEVLEVHDFLWSRAVAHAPEKAAGPGVLSVV